MGMNCPECGAWSLVNETRKSPTFGYRRRRECANGHKFTTKEVVIPESELEQERRDHLEANRELLVAFRESGREIAGAYAPRKATR